MYKVVLTKDAAKYYQKLDSNNKKKINNSILKLKDNPLEGTNIKRLHGELTGLYRYRAGNLRIIYKVEQKELIVVIIAIGSRGDVYK